ncbi:RtcB family protein [Phaeobacter gallaeciensis]|uniref:RtcB family protein n=1 Tax=Phaeobacter gallaeciensis TaxID=60890 RepID=UPI00237FDCB2|nr:RtcB family protein [Phaeobacter gallaeciensis]MDE4297063.1 RtcB family protein [Phaeobacter gallaeciensis]
MKITGKTLIDWGFEPGPWFKEAILQAALMRENGYNNEEIYGMLQGFVPPPKIQMRGDDHDDYANFLPDPENDIERQNAKAVCAAMDQIMRVPTVEAGAVMPDACPAGTIPVGGVVATKDAIHPGYHSADVCCSMAISVFPDRHDPKKVLDAIQVLTHFGPTKRRARPAEVSESFVAAMENNQFLKGLETVAVEHFTTQGDGNHFYYVGHLESTGELAIVSHHGSRGLGAQVYKRGMAAATRETQKIATGVPKGHAWLDMNTDIGQDYWGALSAVRTWTKHNHFEVHDAVLRLIGEHTVRDRFWNPHNFVFQREGLWVHAKGATPSYHGHSHDDAGRTLIPMNMAEPILITEHNDLDEAVGFAPHGAGRNMSRTQFLRENEPEHPKGIDARFWCGTPDLSELPAAYKNAQKVVNAIEHHSLATIADRIMPYGSIMAGDWEQNAPWRNR